MAPRGPLAERFQRRLERAESGCLIWTGRIDRDGYGRVGLGGMAAGAGYTHRVAYELSVGPIPAGMCVCHRCDVRNCCEPSHLFLGTPADNRADMLRKGRQARGFALPHTKLADEQIPAIFAMRREGALQREIAAAFGVSTACIGKVLNGQRRQSVTS
jgi:hypothetical protein